MSVRPQKLSRVFLNIINKGRYEANRKKRNSRENSLQNRLFTPGKPGIRLKQGILTMGKIFLSNPGKTVHAVLRLNRQVREPALGANMF